MYANSAIEMSEGEEGCARELLAPCMVKSITDNSKEIVREIATATQGATNGRRNAGSTDTTNLLIHGVHAERERAHPEQQEQTHRPTDLGPGENSEGHRPAESVRATRARRKPLPKKGDKTVSVWFSNEPDGWCAFIRYGQASIPPGKTDKDKQLLIGKLDQVSLFSDAVAGAIKGGKLDAANGKLQASKSAALKGK
jgi:hypothetical protein